MLINKIDRIYMNKTIYQIEKMLRGKNMSYK